MPAASKRAKKVRTKSEFDVVRLSSRLQAPKSDIGALLWSVDDIRAARSQQLVGNFRRSASLAAAMNTDGAIFSARQNRHAPLRGLDRVVKSRGSTPAAKRVAGEGDALFGPKGIAVSDETLLTINDQRAMHGLGFGVLTWTPREDGSRVDVELRAWPIEHVFWNSARQCFQTATDAEGIVDIVHGDGRWVIFGNVELRPWIWGAVVPLAMIWADRAFGTRDRSGASNSHATAKWIGELPAGVPLQNEDGSDSEELAALKSLLHSMATDAQPYGVKPNGATITMISNTSTAWQIYDSIIGSNGKDANLVLVGQDATASATGGNYVKDSALFGVKNDIVEMDLGSSERGLLTGVIEPWAAINFGTSSLAPEMVWLIPDADEDARIESLGKQDTAFFAAIAAAKLGGFEVDQPYVDALAVRYKISPVPRIAAIKSAAVQSPAAPTSEPGSAGAPPPAPLRIVPP